MKKGDMIFVYGTLRRGERADINKNALIHDVSFIGLDQINGHLYHLGGYPGVTILDLEGFSPSAPTVTGEVYYIGDQSVVSILDHYEGYNHENPDTGLYNRHLVPTKADRAVWVYTYNFSKSQSRVIDDQLIETGDWKNPRLKQTHRIPKVN